MPENIEKALKEAFGARAAAITVDQLEFRTLRPLPASAGRRPAAVATACVIVVVLATALGVYSLQGSNTPAGKPLRGTPSSTSVPGYVGSRWSLSSVQTDGKVLLITASYRATIEFGSDNALGIFDSVNFLSGRYAVTPTGFVTSGIASTLALYSGDDLNRKMAISAIDTIAYGSMANGHSVPSVAARAHLTDANSLVINVAGLTLTFVRAGPAAAQQSPPPTATTNR